MTSLLLEIDFEITGIIIIITFSILSFLIIDILSNLFLKYISKNINTKNEIFKMYFKLLPSIFVLIIFSTKAPYQALLLGNKMTLFDLNESLLYGAAVGVQYTKAILSSFLSVNILIIIFWHIIKLIKAIHVEKIHEFSNIFKNILHFTNGLTYMINLVFVIFLLNQIQKFI